MSQGEIGRELKVAVLGLGFMGSVHARAWRTVHDASLTAVYSGDSTKLTGDLSGIQGNIGKPGEALDFTSVRKYQSIESLLQDREIDAVDICLPTYLHEEVAVASLRAGKHVVVEKPMALNRPSADAILSEAERSGRTLMVAQVLRFFPMYQVLREAICTGRLGRVRDAFFRRRCAAAGWSGWLADPQRSGGGVFDLLIHDADMCLHLFGKPQSVSAIGAEDLAAGIDLIHAQLFYGEGMTATITGGWHHPKAYPFSMEYTVMGDRGTVDYSSLGRGPTLFDASGTAEELPQGDADGYAAELAYFARCCAGKRPPALCPPIESAQAVALMNVLYEARKQNGEKIPCSL